MIVRARPANSVLTLTVEATDTLPAEARRKPWSEARRSNIAANQTEHAHTSLNHRALRACACRAWG
jgi:hypothetical protein|eukprot:COSAG06_NODE_21661_length_749_cov_1.958462_2_plen_66_part_00